MTIDKKGYIFMILLIGIAVTGMGLIYAHSVGQPYRGIGFWGIHATEGGSIHIPGNIIFEAGEHHLHTITHIGTGERYAIFPDHNGTVIVMNNLPFQCGSGQALKGVDVNGYLYCGSLGGSP